MASLAGTVAKAVSIAEVSSIAKEFTRVLTPLLAPVTTAIRVNRAQESASNAGHNRVWKGSNALAVISAMTVWTSNARKLLRARPSTVVSSSVPLPTYSDAKEVLLAIRILVVLGQTAMERLRAASRTSLVGKAVPGCSPAIMVSQDAHNLWIVPPRESASSVLTRVNTTATG